MAWWNSIGLKPNEIAIKSTSSIMANHKMNKFLASSSKYYGNLLDVEEVTGKKNIAEYDVFSSKMRKLNKSNMMNYRKKILIINTYKQVNRH